MVGNFTFDPRVQLGDAKAGIRAVAGFIADIELARTGLARDWRHSADPLGVVLNALGIIWRAVFTVDDARQSSVAV